MKVNPVIIFRREFDDTGILFNPENGEIFGLNPTSAFIWECLGKNMAKPEIIDAMNKRVDSLPERAGADYDEFIEQLSAKGLVT